MKPLFNKILIANRGEIACRAMRTAKRMGCKTVAVYAAADARALHVKHADEAHYLGGNAPSESYLNIDKIIAVCKQTGADAVYPGYGFLSENAQFAQALAAAGITFIGPNAAAITAMGDKITAKNIAKKAGVNCIPGYTKVLENAQQAVAIANDIGYPVMLKASAGGGGKGMRVAHNDQQCLDGFARAASEAASSFGDERLFLEKFIAQPRHIEIQLIADTHGKVLTLHERECSVQRRHQKVIEEAPSPFIDAATRAAMSQQAVLLAQAVDYVSAGTVELIVDKDKKFYFLEMNTRLQVEHPVTEMITGLDLIELMIRVAAGEALPLTQAAVKRTGWSLETRIYAENPARNFMPSSGRLSHYIEPPAAGVEAGIRIDTGVEAGSEIAVFYDPMLAKLVSHGSDRQQAISRMQQALDEYYIAGVDTNINFLSAILQTPRFAAGEIDTHFIDAHFPNGYNPADNAPEDLTSLAAIVATLHFRYQDRAANISDQVPHTQRRARRDWVAITNKNTAQTLDISGESGDFTLHFAEQELHIKDDWQLGSPLYRGTVNGKKISLQIKRRNHQFTIEHRGYTAQFALFAPRTAALMHLMPLKTPPDLAKFLLSPMPGLLVSLNAKVGDTFEAGAELAVVEAMKMENSLRAESTCTIKAVHVQVGETLEVDAPIVEFT